MITACIMVAGFHLGGGPPGEERTPIIDHTHFVGTLYTGMLSVLLWQLKMIYTHLKENFKNCFGGED